MIFTWKKEREEELRFWRVINETIFTEIIQQEVEAEADRRRRAEREELIRRRKAEREELIRDITSKLPVPRPPLPEYLQKLVDIGHIKPDGRTANVPLATIAQELARNPKVVVSARLLKPFCKPDGKPFSTRTIEEAMTK